mgnify:CR=1 FL=1
MKKNRLGKTDLYVTELCFGALPFGPLQKNIPVDECTGLLVEALKAGINFIDTAQMYQIRTHQAGHGSHRHQACHRHQVSCRHL